MPLPWCTSKSITATRCSPCRLARVQRGDRRLVEDAEAHRASASAWWPQGRVAQKTLRASPATTASTPAQAAPTQRITASQLPGDITVSPPSSSA